MGRRNRPGVRPALEPVESRLLPSGVISAMSASRPRVAGVHDRSGFVPSTTSIAVPSNQGVQGVNLAINPTGNLTRREVKLQQFAAVFTGTYVVGPGTTDTEASQTVIRASGGSNQFLHGDLQMRIVTPRDPTTPVGGVSVIFDRNINSNSVLSFDLSGSQADVDRGGRPNKLSVSLDPNFSGGVYTQGYATGIVKIRYTPGGEGGPGVISQGTVTVKIRGQISTTGVGFIIAATGP